MNSSQDRVSRIERIFEIFADDPLAADTLIAVRSVAAGWLDPVTSVNYMARRLAVHEALQGAKLSERLEAVGRAYMQRTRRESHLVDDLLAVVGDGEMVATLDARITALQRMRVALSGPVPTATRVKGAA